MLVGGLLHGVHVLNVAALESGVCDWHFFEPELAIEVLRCLEHGVRHYGDALRAVVFRVLKALFDDGAARTRTLFIGIRSELVELPQSGILFAADGFYEPSGDRVSVVVDGEERHTTVGDVVFHVLKDLHISRL